MKIAAAEALWDTEKPGELLALPDRRVHKDDQDPSFDIEVPGCSRSSPPARSPPQVEGLNQVQAQYEQQYGPGNYIPPVRPVYWAMRVMAYLGTLVALVALSARGSTAGALERPLVPVDGGRGDRVPVLRGARGLGPDRGRRQPWIVQGLLQDVRRDSPSVSAATSP